MTSTKAAEQRDRLVGICKSIVGDPNSVDADTVAAFKKATLGYAGTLYLAPQDALKSIFHSETDLGRAVRGAFEIIDKYDDGEDGDDDGEDGGDNNDSDRSADDDGSDDLTDHPVVQLAQMLVASGHKSDIQSALQYLLHTSHGAALLRRVHTHKGETTMESIEKLRNERAEKLLAIGKSAGAIAMAKILVDDDSAHGIDEHEYTQIVTEHAQRVYPNDRPDAAFAKVFSGAGEDSTLLRKAHAVVRASQFAAGGAYAYPR
jgi:hypothetical protein